MKRWGVKLDKVSAVAWAALLLTLILGIGCKSPSNSSATPSPGPTVVTIAGTGLEGSTDSTQGYSSFYAPKGLNLDVSNNVIVADTYNAQLRLIDTSDASFQTATWAHATPLKFPFGLVATGDSVYISDASRNQIFQYSIKTNTINVLAGTGVAGYLSGQANVAQFNRPLGLALDSSGNIYVADSGNNQIRMIDLSNPAHPIVNLVAGDGYAGTLDATATQAEFSSPSGLVLDASDNIYITDTFNHTIRYYDASSQQVTTVAGQIGVSGYTNGQGTSATFNRPVGIARDSNGVLYVADQLNDAIRTVDTAYNVNTFAGTGYVGNVDGQGTGASFNLPTGITVDASFNVYVADTGNHSIRWLHY